MVHSEILEEGVEVGLENTFLSDAESAVYPRKGPDPGRSLPTNLFGWES
jgi:hypothetical protein